MHGAHDLTALFLGLVCPSDVFFAIGAGVAYLVLFLGLVCYSAGLPSVVVAGAKVIDLLHPLPRARLLFGIKDCVWS
jgi:hypothetical protein